MERRRLDLRFGEVEVVVASYNDDMDDEALCNDWARFGDSDDIDGDDAGKLWTKYERTVL